MRMLVGSAYLFDPSPTGGTTVVAVTLPHQGVSHLKRSSR